MIKTYTINPIITTDDLIMMGFVRYNIVNEYSYKKPLYWYDGSDGKPTRIPYVNLDIRVFFDEGNNINLRYSVVCDNGMVYSEFYDNGSHDNLVLDKVIANFHKTMGSLVKKQILIED